MFVSQDLVRMVLNNPEFVSRVTELQLNNRNLIDRVAALCRRRGFCGDPNTPVKTTAVGTENQQHATVELYGAIPDYLKRQDSDLCVTVVRSCVLGKPV